MIEIRATANWLERLTIIDGESNDILTPSGHALLETALKQLDDWFAGRSTAFTVPLAPTSTARGEALRQAIAAVGYGETLSYGVLARRCGSSPRAIGQACRRNPFPIIIPCHRILSDSGPQYYSGGGGATTKAWLIRFEAEMRGTITAAWAAQPLLL